MSRFWKTCKLFLLFLLLIVVAASALAGVTYGLMLITGSKMAAEGIIVGFGLIMLFVLLWKGL